MKKVLVLLVLLFFINTAQAQEWKEVVPGTWVGTSVESISADVKRISVKKLNEYYLNLSPMNEIVYAKMANYCEKQAGPSKKECLAYVKQSENTAKNTYYSIVEYDVHCKDKKLCTHCAKDYSKDNKLLKETDMESSDMDEEVKKSLAEIRCTDIKFASFGERLWKYSCENK